LNEYLVNILLISLNGLSNYTSYILTILKIFETLISFGSASFGKQVAFNKP